MKRQTADFKVLASPCFTGNDESYNPPCNQNREINRNTSKVSSELVPIQEPASLVNKEGPHLPTGKYQIPVVMQKNTKIWANVQCGGRTCPIFILSYPFSPNCDKNDYSFIEINMHTKSFKDDIYKLYNYTKKRCNYPLNLFTW